ncbi:uncharacterized protein LOC134854218 [Symsagittifera roscoffensis]|uniref:uncharacterized protein LOC134854218 n=1 Tax=Symsagittifera roscoffensis TaxID=84072 RepID=UPI00307C9DC1
MGDKVQNTSFQLVDDIDRNDCEIGDPVEMLDQMADKYKRQKDMYREARDYYFKLNLWVFYLPLLIVQGLTNVLTHTSIRPDFGYASEMRTTVAILNALVSVWTAAQLKLGWNIKTRSASSTLTKYRELSGQIDTLNIILRCQQEKCTKGAIDFVNTCYEKEKSIMENEITIPTFISKKYAVKHLEHLAEEQDEDSDNDAESNAEVSIDLHSTDFNLDENESMVDEEQVDVKEQAPVQAAVVPPTVDDKTNPGASGKTNPAPKPASLKPASPKTSDTKAPAAGQDDKPPEDPATKVLGDFLSFEDRNMNSSLLFKTLLARFRNLKWLYGQAANYYHLMNLAFFYTPLLIFGTINTILTSLIVGDSLGYISLLIIVVSAIVSVLTGLQMTLRWEAESSRCMETHQMYRHLDAETSYRLMLIEKGVTIKHAAEFAWKSRELEAQTTDSVPAIPQYIFSDSKKQQKLLQLEKELEDRIGSSTE